MEARRRVKEQQKRIGTIEFRNTHFSYTLVAEGVEKFVATPEVQSETTIGGDPLEPGQVWTISPGGEEEHPGLYRIEVNEGPGSGDASKTGAKLGMASLLALCTALLKKSIRGGLIIVGEINLGGSIESIPAPVSLAEIAVEKGPSALLMPVSCRRQLIDLSDDMATKIDIQFYSDAKDALLKAIVD